MFDTMTLTKIVGGFCGAFLVFLLGGFFAEFIYEGGGHGEGGHQAYTVDTGSQDHGGGEAAAEVPFADVYAKADAAAGEKLFRQCQACHKVDPGANATGPTLYGIVGRKVDSSEGYSYSGALEKVADTWTPENLNHFLAGPKAFAPGTKMTYKGMASIEDRANLIAWLATHGG